MKRYSVLLCSFVIAMSFAAAGFAGEKETCGADKIKQAQEDLSDLGFYKGDATGKMNPETRKALKEFKKKEMDKKMATGVLDEKTCDMITKKAQEKKEKDKESGKSALDKAQEKIDEGKSKVMPGAEMPE